MPKTFFSLITLAVILGTTANAQKFNPSIDVNVGAAFTKFKNAFENEFNINSKYQITPSISGAVLWSPDSAGFCWKLGLGYRSFSLDFNSGKTMAYPFVHEEVVKVNYIQLPIELGYMKKLNKANLYFMVGIAPGFQTAYNASFILSDENATPLKLDFSNGTDLEGGNIYNKFQLFGLLGFSALFPIEQNFSLGLNISYQSAFTSLENMDATFNFGNSNFWNLVGVYEEKGKSTYSEYSSSGNSQTYEYDQKVGNTKLSAIGMSLTMNFAF